jgi:hypothetical protein
MSRIITLSMVVFITIVAVGLGSAMMQGGLPGIGEGAALDTGNFGKAVGRFGKSLAQNFGADGEPVQPPGQPAAPTNKPFGTYGVSADNPATGGAIFGTPEQRAAAYAQRRAGPGNLPGNPQGTPPASDWNGRDTPSVPQLAQMFGVPTNVVLQAKAAFSGPGGFQDETQRAKMLDYIAAHSDAATKHQYEMEKIGVGQR